jgi:hypothetical protein
MPYSIYKTDGTLLTTIPDGQYDTSTSLTLVGKNLFNFGQFQNTNYVRLLENFSNTTQPTNQLTGQLWWDKANTVMKVYNGANWAPFAFTVISNNPNDAAGTGNLWFDTDTNQLSVNTGGGLVLIGPEAVDGFGTTRMVSTKLQDTVGTFHPVIQTALDDEIIAIIADTAFTLSSTNVISGFSGLVKGFNLKNSATNETQVVGNSSSSTGAASLLNEAGTAFINAKTGFVPNSMVQRDNNAEISATGINVGKIYTATSGVVWGQWTIKNNLTPEVTGGSNLGSSGLQWGNVWTQSLNASASITAPTVNFNTISDQFGQSINKLDTDPTLSANSNSRLPTQAAVKSYVDSASSGPGGVGYTGSRGIIGYTGSAGGGMGGSVNAVTASAPLLSSGGSNPNISLSSSAGAGTYTNSIITGLVVDNFGRVTSVSQSSSSGVNGWARIAGDILLQWGTVYFPAKEGYFGPFNFNINFTSTPYSLVTSAYVTGSNSGADLWVQPDMLTISNAQFYVQYQRGSNPPSPIAGFTWMAVGPV